MEREGNDLVLAWISCLETLLKKTMIRQVPVFCQAACCVCGRGGLWPGELHRTVWAELLKPLELVVEVQPQASGSAKMALPPRIPWQGGSKSHPNHPWRTRALGTRLRG